MTAFNFPSAAMTPKAFSTTLLSSQGIALSGASAQVNGAGGAGSITFPGCNQGYVRVKIQNGGSSDIATALLVALSDGTFSAIITSLPSMSVGNTASGGIDVVIPFTVDFFPTAINVTTTLTGTTKTATMGIEVIATHTA